MNNFALKILRSFGFASALGSSIGMAFIFYQVYFYGSIYIVSDTVVFVELICSIIAICFLSIEVINIMRRK